MTGRLDNSQGMRPKFHPAILAQAPIQQFYVRLPRGHYFATGRVFHQPGTSDMVGMTVGFQAGQQLQFQLTHQRQITRVLFVYGVDENRLSGFCVRQQIRKGRGALIEKLFKDK